ncbi:MULTISPECIES: tape measure protein [Cyanophyceae]|uniref:tape measure protein n=1 Tax=Cyanophyceae TaxID=3028117 RepID=UPI0016892EE0|nr:tape measure protein [Trichocoleus sp. FACHB-40]MBD2005609.1 tape measure protein [Trichocoleus sp. FACHB-40]
MTSIGELSVDLKLDTAQFDRQIKGLGNQYKDFQMPVRFEFSGLEQEFKHYRDKYRTQGINVPVRLKLDMQSQMAQLQRQVRSQVLEVPVNVKYASSSGSRSENNTTTIIRIDEAALKRVISSSIDDVEEGLSKSISNSLRKIRSGGLLDLLASPLKNAVRGFQEGIGLTYAQKLTTGFVKNLESEIGTSLINVGNNLSKYFTSIGKGVGNKLLQKAGFEQGIEDLKPKLLEIRNVFTEIIDTQAINNKLEVLEKRIVTFFDGILRLNPLKANLKNLARVGETFGDIAATPFEGMGKRRQRIIRETANDIKKNYAPNEQAESVSELAEYITLVSGGFAGEQGKSSEKVAQKVGALLGSKHHIVPIKDIHTDVSESVGNQGALKWTAESALKIASHNLQNGINPDAVEMAKKAYELHQQTKKPVRLVGYSAGGFVAHDAAEILKQLKVPVKAIGLGTPHWGKLSKLDPATYQTVLRESDGVTNLVNKAAPILGAVSPNKTKITPGFGHELATYLSEPTAQKHLLSFLEGASSGVKKDFLNPEAFRVFDYKKNIEVLLSQVESSIASPIKDPTIQKAILSQSLEGIKELRVELDKSLEGLSENLKEGIDEYLDALKEAEEILSDMLGVSKQEVTPNVKISQEEITEVANKVKTELESNLESKPINLHPDMEISEEALLKEVKSIQSKITTNLRKAFKGTGKNKQLVNEQLAGETLTEVDVLRARLDRILAERKDLSSKARQTLGQTLGTTANQYNNYSPLLRDAQSKKVKQALNNEVVTASNLDIEGLPRVDTSKENALQRIKAIASRLLKRQTSSSDPQKIYESIIRESARVSKVKLNQSDIPKLVVDDTYLKGIGAKAFYSIKKNQIIISKETEKILKSGYDQIIKDSNKLVDIVHESRHAFQFDFGRSSLAQVFTGIKKLGVNLIPKEAAPQRAWLNALRSMQSVKEGAGKLLPKDFVKLIGRTELDAYAFESFTPDIIRGAVGNVKNKSLGKTITEGLFGKASEINNSVRNQFKDLKSIGREIGNAFNLGGDFKQKLSSTIELVRELGNKAIPGLGDSIINLGGALLSLTALKAAFSTFSNFVKTSLDISLKFETLSNTLKFVSGGSAQAARNMSFIREEAKRLNTPLMAGVEGFTKFSAAVKGTLLEKQAQGIFGAVSQASSVMGSSAEETQGIYVALQQMSAKGKISAEEWRGQLSERLPMATAVATRALGVTTEEFSRMLDNGQLLSQDFLPRFTQQLASETAGGVAGAANTGQAALNRFNSSLTDLQLSVGQGALPIQKLGLNLLSGILESASKNGAALTQTLSAMAVVGIAQLIPPVFALIKSLPFVKTALGGISAGMAAVGAAAKTMALQFAFVFGAIELFKLGSTLFSGGDLAKDFKNLESAANDAAKGISEVKNATDSLSKNESPSASNWSDAGILGLRSIDPTGLSKNIVTFSELDRDRAVESIYESRGAIFEALLEVRKQVGAVEKGSSPLNLLEGVDSELQRVSQNRKILQAQIKREFTDLGKAVPPELKKQLAELNTQFGNLSQQRTDIAKPFTEKLTQLQKAADEAKAKLDFLDTPEGKDSMGGADIEGLRRELTLTFNQAREGQMALEKLLQTSKADPVLALSQAFRLLNIELANNAEKSQFAAAARQEGIAQQQLSGFSKDYFAPQRAALANAQAERDRIEREMSNLESSIQKRRTAIGEGANAPILAELGVTTETSAAEIQSVLDRLPDSSEAQKKALEGMKAIKEDELKLAQSRVQVATSELQERQQVEAASLAIMQKAVNERESLLKREENGTIIAVRRKQQGLLLTEEQAAEEIAKISLKSTERQIGNIFDQRKAYFDLFTQGKISAQQFHDKDRELTNQLSDLKKQAVEQELQLRQQANQRILADLELANRKVESSIAQLQQSQVAGVKDAQLSGKLNETDAQAQIHTIGQNSAVREIEQTKNKLTQLDDLGRRGVKSAREVLTEKLQLQQQLGQQQIQLLDTQLQEQKRLRDEANAQQEADLAQGKELAIRGVKSRQASGDISEREAAKEIEAIQARSLSSEIRLTEQKLAQNISTQERRQLEGQLQQQLTQTVDFQISAEKRTREEAQFALDDKIRNHQRISEEQSRQIDLQSKQNELLVKSDEQLKTVLESRQSLSKALSDAKIASLEAPLEQLKKAEELFGRLLSEDGLLNAAGNSLASKATANLRDVIVGQIRAAGVAIDPTQLRSLIAQSKQSGSAGEAAKGKLAEIELAVLNNRFALENQLAEAKKQAQEAERKHSEVMMQFDLKRTEMQARQALYAAKKEEIESRSAIEAAKIEEEKAALLEDPRERNRAITDARSKERLAKDAFANAQGNLQLAQENLSYQSEMQANALRTMQATQQSQRSQEAAADAARNNAQQLERAEKAAKRLAESAASEASSRSGGGGFTFRVGSKEWEQNRQAKDAFQQSFNSGVGDRKSNLLTTAMSMQDNPFFAMMLQQNNMGDIAQLAGQLKDANPIQLQATMASAKVGNKDVIEELRKLNENISSMASRPTNLNVSTASPVRDAASIYGDLGKQSMRSSNL